MKLRKEVKARWVKALKSGEYQQGRGALRRAGTFCCLGVLCDLAVKDGIGRWTGDGFKTADGIAYSVLPSAVVEWAFNGIGVTDPKVTTKTGERVSLTWLNDGAGASASKSFTHIANRIKESL